MKSIVLITTTILLLIFSSCNNKTHEILCESSVVPTELISEATTDTTTSTIILDPTVVETESVIDNLLNVAPGSFLLRHTDDEMNDYLDYYLFIPENATKNMPLIIFLHGDGEVNQPELLENYGMIQYAREIYDSDFPFIAISPCTRVKSWTDGNLPNILMNLILAVSKDYCIDVNSIIITGHSRGSAGCWHMISLYEGFFSKAVLISSPPQTSISLENCSKTPLMAFAGTVGEFENWALGRMSAYVSQLNEINNLASLTVLAGSDHSETCKETFTKATFEWMLSDNEE